MKTTKQQFKFFCHEFDYWLERFGIKGGWELFYMHENYDDDDLATIVKDTEARTATLYLTTEWDDTIEPLNIPRLRVIAFEEACHLLFAPLSHLIKPSKKIDEIAMGEEHNIINRLWGIINRKTL